MKKILLLLVTFITIISCNSDTKTENAETLNAQFIGEFTNYGTSSELEAYLVIDNNNTITINFLMGKLIGTATKNEENYSFTITNAEGIFKDIFALSGEIDILSKTLSMSGSNADGTLATFSGDINEMFTGGWENVAKSRVIFVNNESDRTASVSINGITHNGLMHSYYTDSETVTNSCDQLLAWTYMRGNFDAIEKLSDINCDVYTLKGLDGNPVTYTACNSIYFILDKNIEYTYTVTWSTGETYTGQFTSLDGGGNLPICLSFDGNNSGSTGTGQFTINGNVYATGCSIENTPSPNCPEMTNTYMFTSDSYNRFILLNMPQASSGTYPILEIANVNEASNYCYLSGICVLVLEDKYYLTQSGTLTKTGAKSYTFSCIVYNADNPSETKTVTGSGTY